MISESYDTLLCIPDKYQSSDRAPANTRLQIDWLHWPRQRNFRNIFFARHLAMRIKSWNPHIVHFLNEGSAWNWLTAAFLKHFKIITTVHDVSPHIGDTSSRKVPRFFANALIRRSDAIIVHGDKLRGDASRVLPVALQNIFSVPHLPLLLQSGSTLRKRPNDGVFRVLFYGRIYEYKGLRYLLEAAPIVRAAVPNVQFIIAGRGDDLAHYMPYVTDASYIEFRNRFLTLTESAQLFADADLLALPYIEASQSGPLMTAMAFGLPVVATDVGELSSVVRSTGMGLVIPSRDKDALAASIIKIAQDNQLWEQLRKNATKAFHGEYSREAIGGKVIRIYQSLQRTEPNS